MSLFNNAGQLNASSLKDALATIVKYASVLEDNNPYGLSSGPQLTDAKRDELISRALMTQDGKLALAQSMANPIN